MKKAEQPFLPRLLAKDWFQAILVFLLALRELARRAAFNREDLKSSTEVGCDLDEPVAGIQPGSRWAHLPRQAEPRSGFPCERGYGEDGTVRAILHCQGRLSEACEARRYGVGFPAIHGDTN